MSLTDTLHLMAGLGALALGGGVLIRDPARARSRAFAALCGALALWSLGFAGSNLATSEPAQRLLARLMLVGSCATAPLAVHFAWVLAGASRHVRGRSLIAGGIVAGTLWIGLWTPLYDGPAWSWIALGVLGGMLLLALGIVGRHAYSLPAGPERRASQLVLWGGVIAVVGGLSDFLPRGDPQALKLGSPAILLFLLVVCAVVVRHRFLDVDLFLIRIVALVAGATVTALIYRIVLRFAGDDFIALFITSILVLASAGPLGRLILGRARSMLSSADPIAGVLLEVSRRLPRATSIAEVWQTIEDGRRALPEEVRLDIYLRRQSQSRFHLIHRAGTERRDEPVAVMPDAALPRLLGDERAPLTRRYLEQERREAHGAKRRLAEEVLEQLQRSDLRLVAPLIGGERLAGWIGAGGDLDDGRITAEVATAFMAVGNQAAASLARLEALELARRKESLAAVGELAAGLAHEVRNPVAAIHGAAQAMGPQATETQRREMAEVIQEETGRLERVVGEFLEYARPGAPRRERLDLERLVRRALHGLDLAGKKLDVELSVDPRAGAGWGDPDQLHRAFENLARNAWEAMGDGGRLRIEIQPEGEGAVAVRFEDNGPGIPEAQIQELFQPFYSTKPGGTGLGLALIHRIVDAHGGEIRVEGREGLGAVFTLVVPVVGGEKEG
jgi:signal transduction histidine kinase